MTLPSEVKGEDSGKVNLPGCFRRLSPEELVRFKNSCSRRGNKAELTQRFISSRRRRQFFKTALNRPQLHQQILALDGVADLVVANHSNSFLSLLAGNGSGGFSAAVPLTVGNGPIGVAIGECLGYRFTGAWTVLVGVAMLQWSAFDAWLAWPGIVVGLTLVGGPLEFVGPFEEKG